MHARTIKGSVFTIIVDSKRITVKHVFSKGKRCRVILPDGVMIESGDNPNRASSKSPKGVGSDSDLRS